MAEKDEEQTPVQRGSYSESEDHVPDPTAVTGTLETSGTGGGHNERLIGMTRIFGDVEHIARRVDSLIHDHTTSLAEQVRGLLLKGEASARTAQIPQQSVEENGLPTHTGNVIAGHDDSGAAKDADRSANVAGSPDDVTTGAKQVEDPAKDSYQQTTIAGAGDPQEPVKAAEQAEEKSGDKTDFERAAEEHERKLDDVVSGKTPAKKTTPARRTGGTTKK